jgi:DNA-binding NtrC family response regulator
MASFLIVNGEPHASTALCELLETDGHEVAAVADPHEAMARLERASFDAVVTDLEAPHGGGASLVRFVGERHPDTCVLVTTTRAPRKMEMKHICEVFEKPLHYESIAFVVERCRGTGRRGCPRRTD